MSHATKIIDDGKDLLQCLNVALQEAFNSKNHRDINFGDNNRGWFITSVNDTYYVRNMSGPVATFSLKEFPGCCGILVSYYSEVQEKYRKLGLGKLLLEVRMSAARHMRYGQLSASVLSTNEIEKHLLNASGWIKTGEFRNPKTQNIVETYQVNL